MSFPQRLEGFGQLTHHVFEVLDHALVLLGSFLLRGDEVASILLMAAASTLCRGSGRTGRRTRTVGGLQDVGVSHGRQPIQGPLDRVPGGAATSLGEVVVVGLDHGVFTVRTLHGKVVMSVSAPLIVPQVVCSGLGLASLPARNARAVSYSASSSTIVFTRSRTVITSASVAPASRAASIASLIVVIRSTVASNRVIVAVVMVRAPGLRLWLTDKGIIRLRLPSSQETPKKFCDRVDFGCKRVYHSG